MVLKEEANLAAQACNFAPFVTNRVGGIKSVVVLLIISEIHRHEGLAVELRKVMTVAIRLYAIFDVQWLNLHFFIGVNNAARTALDADFVGDIVGSEKVDR